MYLEKTSKQITLIFILFFIINFIFVIFCIMSIFTSHKINFEERSEYRNNYVKLYSNNQSLNNNINKIDFKMEHPYLKGDYDSNDKFQFNRLLIKSDLEYKKQKLNEKTMKVLFTLALIFFISNISIYCFITNNIYKNLKNKYFKNRNFKNTIKLSLFSKILDITLSLFALEFISLSLISSVKSPFDKTTNLLYFLIYILFIYIASVINVFIYYLNELNKYLNKRFVKFSIFSISKKLNSFFYFTIGFFGFFIIVSLLYFIIKI